MTVFHAKYKVLNNIISLKFVLLLTYVRLRKWHSIKVVSILVNEISPWTMGKWDYIFSTLVILQNSSLTWVGLKYLKTDGCSDIWKIVFIFLYLLCLVKVFTGITYSFTVSNLIQIKRQESGRTLEDIICWK